MKRIFFLILLLIPTVLVWGQTEFRYWFDEDLSTLKTAAIRYGVSSFEHDISSLDNGLHTINWIIMKDGSAVSIKSNYFYKNDYNRLNSNNTYIFYSFEDEDADSFCKIYKNSDGMFHSNIDVSEIEIGDHTVNAFLTDGRVATNLATASFVKVSPNAVMGDVNGDGEISVVDLNMQVDYILNGRPKGFVFDFADLDGDGVISINDILYVVKIILYQ